MSEDYRDKQNGIAVYTCITGNYDTVNEPLVVEDNCDYYLITDSEYKNDTVYSIIQVDDIVPKKITSYRDKNRYCKMHGYSIFHRYRYSIYLDGILQIIGKISELTKGVGQYGLGFHSHPYAKDPYMEALSLSIRLMGDRKEAKEEARAVVNRFAIHGLPRHCGSVECGLIVCDNQNEMSAKILNAWFEEYMIGEMKRDQLYLPYVLYKMGIDISKINTFHQNLRYNGVCREACEDHVGRGNTLV